MQTIFTFSGWEFLSASWKTFLENRERNVAECNDRPSSRYLSEIGQMRVSVDVSCKEFTAGASLPCDIRCYRDVNPVGWMCLDNLRGIPLNFRRVTPNERTKKSRITSNIINRSLFLHRGRIKQGLLAQSRTSVVWSARFTTRSHIPWPNKIKQGLWSARFTTRSHIPWPN